MSDAGGYRGVVEWDTKESYDSVVAVIQYSIPLKLVGLTVPLYHYVFHKSDK